MTSRCTLEPRRTRGGCGSVRFEDVTERERAEAPAGDVAEEALPLAGGGSCRRWCTSTRSTTLSTALYVSPLYDRLTGYSAEERIADPDLWVRMLHPDDRDRVLAESLRTNDPVIRSTWSTD